MIMNEKNKGYIAAIISVAILGSVGIFVRNIAANSYIITFARVFFGLLFLIIFLCIKKELFKLKYERITFSLVITGALLSFAILCYTNAIKYTSLSIAAFILNMGPVLAACLATVFLKEKFTFKKGVLLFLAFLGFMLVLEFKFSLSDSDRTGNLWAFGAAVCYSLFIVFNRNIPARISTLNRSFYQFLIAVIVMAPFINSSIGSLTMESFYWLIAIGFFQGFLALTLFTFAMKYLQAIEYGTISYMEPLVASLTGFIVYAESVSVIQVFGFIIILVVGLLQIYYSKRSTAKNRTHSRQI